MGRRGRSAVLSLAEEQALAEADMAEDIFGKAEAESWLEEAEYVAVSYDDGALVDVEAEALGCETESGWAAGRVVRRDSGESNEAATYAIGGPTPSPSPTPHPHPYP